MRGLAEGTKTYVQDFNSSPTFLTDAACGCMNDFVRAELDYETPGKRGLGRTTDLLPRFAGRHRDKCERMDIDGCLVDLGRHFKRHLVCGYMFHEIGAGCTERVKPGLSKTALWEMWIPSIMLRQETIETFYCEHGVSKAQELFFRSTVGSIADHMSSYVSDVRADVEIIQMYFFSGALLRFLETCPLSEEERLDVATGGAYSASKNQTDSNATGKSGCAVAVALLLAIGGVLGMFLLTNVT